MLNLLPQFESWRAPLEEFLASLPGKGDLTCTPGHGDYMQIVWRPDPKGNPGRGIGERLIANPALPGQPPFTDNLAMFRDTFLYNLERDKRSKTTCIVCSGWFAPGSEWDAHMAAEYEKLAKGSTG